MSSLISLSLGYTTPLCLVFLGKVVIFFLFLLLSFYVDFWILVYFYRLFYTTNLLTISIRNTQDAWEWGCEGVVTIVSANRLYHFFTF